MLKNPELARVKIGLCYIAYGKCGRSQCGQSRVGEPWGGRLKELKIDLLIGADFGGNWGHMSENEYLQAMMDSAEFNAAAEDFMLRFEANGVA